MECTIFKNTKYLDKDMLSISKCFNVNINKNMMFNLFYDLQIYGIEITYEI